jgi:putative ABC transport system permease protein
MLRTAPRAHLAMLRQDCGYAWRMMRREKTFALAAILVLALGIGGNTAIFSVVHAVLLKPLPFPEPDRLYYVWGDNTRIGHEAASLPDFVDWRAQNTVFEDLTAISPRNVTVAAGGEAERVIGARVSDSFFRVLGVRPAIGRGFTPDDDRPGAPRVVVLADSLWRRRFGADPAIVGRAVTIEATPFTVAGVAPPGFAFPRAAEAWTPLAMSAQAAHRRGDFLLVIGRLKRGVSPERAAATMRTIGSRLERQYPDTNTGWSVALVPAHEQIVGRTRPALLALWTAVGCLLLVACTNVANLLLARGAARSREMAIRAALGAGRARLFRQSMTESIMFALLGGGLGLALAFWGVALLVRFGPADTPRLAEAGLHPQVLVFTLAISVATGLVFGLVPASRAGRETLHGDLKEGGRHGDARSHARLGNALVAVQMALSLVLLTGAGLMGRSFAEITRVDPGFRTEGVLTFRLSPPAAAYAGDDKDQRLRGFYDQVIARMKTLPGVRSAAATSGLYLTGTGVAVNSFSIEGVPDPPPNQEPDAHTRSMTEGFHETLGVPLVRGRTFRASDVASGPLVAIINRTFARRYFPNADPIGRRVSFDGANGHPIWREIVGVVGDARQDGLDQSVYPEIETPFAQTAHLAMTVVVRSDGDLGALVRPVRERVRELDAAVPLFDVQTLEAAVADSVATRRFSAWLLGAFALLALALAACGLYGVVAYRVARSQQEIGVRMALGADPGAIVRMVIVRGMSAALAGLAVGVPAAWVLAQYLRTLLFGVVPHDPLTFAGGAGLLLATCLVACYVPARRATRVDPLTALRAE